MIASVVGFALRLKVGPAPHPVIDNLNARIKAWWVMAAAIGLALLAGKGGVIVLFAFVSFVALREFATIAPTRRGDHRALLDRLFRRAAAAVLLRLDRVVRPLLDLHTGLRLPRAARSWRRCRETCATSCSARRRIQWGLMITVFCISHVPALLTLDIPGYEGRNAFLLVFLILVVQSSDVLQYVWGKLAGRRKIAPELSPSKTVEGFVGGVASAIALGAALWWITPFSPSQAAAALARDHAHGFPRRARHVRAQARPRREGLGRVHRRPRRHARPARFRLFFGAGLLSPRALLVGASSGLCNPRPVRCVKGACSA